MSESESGARSAPAVDEAAEGSGRRQFIKGAAATAAATAAVTTAGDLMPGQAQAAERSSGAKSRFPFPLPAAGVEVPCSCYAANVPLQINTGIVNLDFKGGIRVRVETNDNDGLKLKIIGHKVTAVIPKQLSVTIEQSDTELTPLSVLNMARSFPPSPQMLMYLDFKLTITWLDGRRKPPLTVSTLNPAQLLATNVTQFPPSNLTYNLQAPVPLGAPGTDPAEAPVTLQGFPVTVNQWP
ncbi:MAG: hypothetical protein AUG49_09990 [Catenulispora sp. 13_1_20CM_3_70_7]|nr:MAG: hypothetical protein AUG49_09990 [Catenulispora sp. 13_1_20CM_3_70_7]